MAIDRSDIAAMVRVPTVETYLSFDNILVSFEINVDSTNAENNMNNFPQSDGNVISLPTEHHSHRM